MTRQEIGRELSTLYEEMETATRCDEATVCLIFNTDSREEAIQAIRDERRYYERKLRELDEYEHRKLNYERTADAPYICW